MVSCNYVYTDVRFRIQCCIWFYYYYLAYIRYTSWVRIMVFNATLNNIAVISWRSVVLVEETGAPGENHVLPIVTDKFYHIILYRVHLV